MKPLVEKLPLSENRSFVAGTHATPNFEVPWHQHIELELILFKEGAGSSYVGNSVGSFAADDIYFLGSNLPHTFQKADKNLFTSAIVVHFKEDFWGDTYMQLPETRSLRELFKKASGGLKLTGMLREQLRPEIESLEKANGLRSIIGLCKILDAIAESEEYEIVSTQEITNLNQKHQERIDRIFRYTIDNFQDEVILSDIADCAGMSIPAFCNYFKKSTKKTFITFLNEVRIANACKKLMDTQMTIEEICYDSGYSTIANFNKQFMKIKATTPSQYRKAFIKRNLIESEMV